MLKHDQEIQAREIAEATVRRSVERYAKTQHQAAVKKVCVPDNLFSQIAVAVVDALLQPDAEAELAAAAAKTKAQRLNDLRCSMQQRAIDMHVLSLDMNDSDWAEYEKDADEFSPHGLGQDVTQLLEEGSF